jgi:DMSO/TMAO reductase YedYZ molybdopterin-dependent catalytic subunit
MTFYSSILMIALGLLFTNIAEVQAQRTNVMQLVITTVAANIMFGGSASIIHRATAIKVTAQVESRPVNMMRRRFFLSAASTAMTALLLYYGFTFFSPRRSNTTSVSSGASRPTRRPQQNLEGVFATPGLAKLVDYEITPNEEFYKVQVNLFDPQVNAQKWSLKVDGLVERPLNLTYQEVQALPYKDQYTTLECVSNEIGGDLIGNALWRGVQLKELLQLAGVKPEATYVAFTCYDGYTVGISLDKALRENCLLAYQMNGETLPAGHGFPLRAVVPGIYGMMNAKWITEIHLVEKEFEGFWQRKGWTNDARINTNTIIETPEPGDVKMGKVTVGGIAFAGDRGISNVQLSFDDGRSWHDADLKKPVSELSWVLWGFEWEPPAAGTYRITARAADGTGQLQTENIRGPFPDGATGYHIIKVNVV